MFLIFFFFQKNKGKINRDKNIKEKKIDFALTAFKICGDLAANFRHMVLRKFKKKRNAQSNKILRGKKLNKTIFLSNSTKSLKQYTPITKLCYTQCRFG